MTDGPPTETGNQDPEFGELREQVRHLDLDSVTQIILTQQRDLADALDALKNAETYDWTGLVGKKGIELVLGIEMDLAKREGKPLTFVFLDLVKFKKVNDTFGQATGDKAIRRFAAFLKNQVRGSDLVGHPGGDEFLFIMPDTTVEEAEQVVKRSQEDLTKEKGESEGEDVIQMIEFRSNVETWNQIEDVDAFMDRLSKKMFEEERK